MSLDANVAHQWERILKNDLILMKEKPHDALPEYWFWRKLTKLYDRIEDPGDYAYLILRSSVERYQKLKKDYVQTPQKSDRQ